MKCPCNECLVASMCKGRWPTDKYKIDERYNMIYHNKVCDNPFEDIPYGYDKELEICNGPNKDVLYMNECPHIMSWLKTQDVYMILNLMLLNIKLKLQLLIKEKKHDLWEDPNSKYNSSSCREKMSKASKKTREDPNSKFNSIEYRNKIKLSIKQIKEKYPTFYKEEQEKVDIEHMKNFIKFYITKNKDDFFMTDSMTFLGYYYRDIIENKDECQKNILSYIRDVFDERNINILDFLIENKKED